MRAPFFGLLLFSPEMLALERLLPWLPCALPWTAFRAQICAHDRAGLLCEDSLPDATAVTILSFG